jgi:hypothetical protein
MTMDAERRAALEARREERIRQRERDEQLRGLEAFRAALTEAGEPFEILYWGEEPAWTPDWVPAGYSRVAWELHPPVEETWLGGNEAGIGPAFRKALLRCAGPDDPLLLVFEGRLASFRMSRAVAERHAEAVVGEGVTRLSPLWVTSPPAQWLIEVSYEAVRIGEPRA